MGHLNWFPNVGMYRVTVADVGRMQEPISLEYTMLYCPAATRHSALAVSSATELSCAAAGAEVVCEIEDNGPGMPQKGPRSGAFGLRSVSRRLALKYEGASLRFESNGNGTRSIVRLPRSPNLTSLEERAP